MRATGLPAAATLIFHPGGTDVLVTTDVNARACVVDTVNDLSPTAFASVNSGRATRIPLRRPGPGFHQGITVGSDQPLGIVSINYDRVDGAPVLGVPTLTREGIELQLSTTRPGPAIVRLSWASGAAGRAHGHRRQ